MEFLLIEFRLAKRAFLFYRLLDLILHGITVLVADNG